MCALTGKTSRISSAFRSSRRRRFAGFAITEVVIAAAVLVLTAVGTTHALLTANRKAASARVLTAAKTAALSRIQQVSQCAYDPEAIPPVIPPLLAAGTRRETIDIGDESTDLGDIPATVEWTVNTLPGPAHIRSVRCRVSYTYLGQTSAYELFTYRSAD